METMDRPDGEFDVVVVGAGFAGIGMLRRLSGSGLTVRAFDSSDVIGGTWAWNTYPGARTDCEAWYYCYSYPEICDEWDWPERYATQPQVQAYLEFVVARFGLADKIELGTTVSSAVHHDRENLWRVATADGRHFTAKWLVAATGLLSKPFRPEFPGLEEFRGEYHWASLWPQSGVNYEGRRVGVVGTGSTSVQMAPILAQRASHLYILQRTPHFILEARNRRLDTGEMADIKSRYREIWAKVDKMPNSMDIDLSGRLTRDATAEERDEAFEAAWQAGGFRFLFSAFDDIMTDVQANEHAAEFLRSKIKELVHDPEVAETLTPRGYPFGSKRVVVGHEYYSIFNRSNVTLVDVQADGGGLRFTERGVICGDEEIELDVVLLATGFDAYTGALSAIDIRGRDGRTLTGKWAEGLRTYLGIAYEGFPNLFVIDGPHSPFANIPIVAERQADWIGDTISWMRDNSLTTMEPSVDAEDQWTKHISDLGDQSLVPQGEQARSWFYGANIPGKRHEILVWVGSGIEYFDWCRSEAADGYPNFRTE